jgi:outer membrane lipoprotein-sorting protein
MKLSTCIFSFFILLLFKTSDAQTFVQVKDEAALRKKIVEASQKLNTIQCDFVQEKNLSMLSEKAISKGKFYFKRESKVRLEYLEPTKSLLAMDNGKMTMQDSKKTTRTDMHRIKAFQQLNTIIVGSINGTLFSNPDFSVRFSENNTQVRVELKPLAKMLKNYLSTIVIVLEKKDFTANRIEMNEVSGDNTILTFSNKQINGPVEDSLFVVK